MWTEKELAAARLRAAARQRPSRDRAGGQTDSARLAALTTLDEVYISRYLAPFRDKTRRRYHLILLDWLWWCTRAGIHTLEAEQYHIEQWAKSLAHQGNSRSTVAGKLVPVCGYYRWAHQHGLTAVDVAAYVRRPSRPRRSRLTWLSREQLGDLLERARRAGPPADLLIHLLALNGLRLGECLESRVEHLGAVDDKTTLKLPNRKGGVLDTVSLPGETIACLPGNVRGRERGRLLLTATGRVMTPTYVYRLLDQMTAGWTGPKVRPHMLRATFVTLSLDAGVPARDVMASTGHAHTSMVDYYDRAHASIRRNAAHTLAAYLHTES
ncbi:MAG: site-specific integrase [Dermatophilaceae bacterium]|nr:site-specific integrase [Dermatophilaceae bacterium]